MNDSNLHIDPQGLVQPVKQADHLADPYNMKTPFTKTFDEPGDFGSYHAAAAWLMHEGYSCGSMCSGLPTAIIKGREIYIAKWKNLSGEERSKVDGTIEAPSFRNGPVTVTLKDRPAK